MTVQNEIASARSELSIIQNDDSITADARALEMANLEVRFREYQRQLDTLVTRLLGRRGGSGGLFSEAINTSAELDQLAAEFLAAQGALAAAGEPVGSSVSQSDLKGNLDRMRALLQGVAARANNTIATIDASLAQL